MRFRRSSSAVDLLEISRTIAVALSALLLSGASVPSPYSSQRLLRAAWVILPLSPKAAAVLRSSELANKRVFMPLILGWPQSGIVNLVSNLKLQLKDERWS